ncbi:hypothetical protein JRO89_XS10G0186000 [Xanthoceras sorbifolium]|uniref:HAT C-terminal dimerisation domain-containing protein n=1 Tax=Xanthoceras sorbifolium TaxID=99658 RepID=A0ABQ8HJG4_9ROSI|nr:hypothetical protein JRO89_XS10G0186000 [Xanthoceras sorbifolium]
MGTGGGNTAFQCNFCHQVYRGSYSRVKLEEAELRVKQYLPRQVPLPYTMAFGSSNKTCSTGASNYYGLQMQLPNVEPKKRKAMKGPLEKAFNNNAREELDGEIARMFYTGSLLFHFVRNPHYVRAFTKAYNNPIAGYVPPGYNVLRTTLLQKEKISIGRMLGPFKDSWKDKSVSVCSNRWSDFQRRPLINIMAVCESGPMFLRAVNCEWEYKDKHFIANLLIESIREIGPQNVVFSGAIEDFASSDSVEDRDFMAPMKWWLFHGASTPILQSIAFKLLGQPCSFSCCERNWSTYNFIHSMRRNNMTPQRAEDLVYVYTNLCLLSRRSPTYNEGPSQQWDVGGDGFDSMNMENSGILKTADLSLDEPDLEAVLFSSSDSVIVDE